MLVDEAHINNKRRKISHCGADLGIHPIIRAVNGSPASMSTINTVDDNCSGALPIDTITADSDEEGSDYWDYVDACWGEEDDADDEGSYEGDDEDIELVDDDEDDERIRSLEAKVKQAGDQVKKLIAVLTTNALKSYSNFVKQDVLKELEVAPHRHHDSDGAINTLLVKSISHENHSSSSRLSSVSNSDVKAVNFQRIACRPLDLVTGGGVRDGRLQEVKRLLAVDQKVD